MPLDLPSPAELDRLRLVAIVASADDAIVSKDLDGTVRTWNPAAERIFGYSPEEIVGASIFKLIPPDLHDEERGLLARIRQGEHIAHYETDRVRKDGRRIRVSLTLSPLRDGSGQLIGASAIKRDVTAQRALEARLQNAQRMEAVGRLAGGIAHDFNNLLTVMGGMAALALKDAPDGSAVRRSLTHIIDAAERAGALTRELLTFGRRQLAELEVLQLNNVIRRLQALLHPLFGEHITVRTLLAHDLGLLRANTVQLEQVVMNLALNARDAMPDGGTLTIRTENTVVDDEEAASRLRLAPGPYVVLAVCDTGEGMDAVTQASIFDPFFTTKQTGHGTGLGLSTVYAIVQDAGGAIDVRSEPGQGSEFTVYLPRVTAPEGAPGARAAEESAPAEDSSHRGTILLVEDEPGVRGFTSEVLQSAGYHVLQGGSGEEALAVAADFGRTIDVLLTDVVLPGINGRMLAEQLLANHPDTKVLYMSGYTDDMVLRTGVITRSAAFLPKPFTPQGLLARVQALRSESRPSGGAPRLP